MSFSTQWDTAELSSLPLAYDRITNELEEEPIRLVSGSNVYVTLGKKIAKRPGTIALAGSSNTNRIVRMWGLESLDQPPSIYILASVYIPSIARYRMEYINLDAATPAWTNLGSLRDVDESLYPHEVTVSRGRAYIKSFPDASGDKLGSVVFDPTGGTPVVRIWGALPPTSPTAVVGAITRITAAVSSLDTSFTVNSSTGFPATPFDATIEFEDVTVTSVVHPTWTVTRGVNGTVAAAHSAGEPILWRNWSTSDHLIDVSLFWRYSYCKKTVTGHYSSRAPLETNPDKLPSQTGPFFDQVPKITVTGDADTTNIPSLVIMRSEDGGGVLYELKTITNTGAGSITFEDKFLESGASGGTFNDPLPDEVLNRGLRSPSETGQNPPPTVTGTKVVGTDAVSRSTPIETYAGRLWFAIDNILFFSGQEEVLLGIPEESWDYGTASGRFFRFPSPITNIKATNDALYVFTVSGTTFQVTGTNGQTFNFRPVFDNIGAPYNHPAAITRFGSTVALLTHDFRIVLIENDQYRAISDPLFTDLIDSANLGARFELTYFGDLEKEWLIVAAHNDLNPLLSRQWIYDLRLSEQFKRDFWSPPWTIKATAMLSSRVFTSQSQRRLVFYLWDPDTNTGRLARLDPTNRTGTDPIPGTGAGEGFNWDFVTSLFRVPPGNHVNQLRVPGAVPAAYELMIDRLQFTSADSVPDRDPDVFYFWDDLWTQPIQTQPVESPARRRESLAYRTMVFPLYNTGQRIAVMMRQQLSSQLVQICNLAMKFAPNSGV